ncbi:TetR/AcrR family transcriptional regulator [Nocardioides bizhenqiangii]|uniref:TetR/AcrR family transcriptional regulator n=1 Tax=Nocardioides bizhenqiangii TaxID=3095076 RepID=A0ABZ0ZMZ3_9ACTN|nr:MULTISPECIES: TetR/AcrR family transcriptional regulator [unclassified Nocardioides]MDZ5620779.1 TetR/AcrR family transcriptional regulator [Nocardioides sp. HM23]WQQ25144.1 TetR/AcrR family transcriptional regulator [Nocardioides sp. HM61]
MPRDGSFTRDRILAAARRLVIDNGFRATTVESVIAASGSSKGAFFHHFPSKRDLADALVAEYVADDLEMLEQGMAAAYDAGPGPADRAVAFVRFYEDMADEIMTGTTGCLYTSVLAEMDLVDAGTSDPITKAVTIWRERYAELLTAAVGDRSDIDVPALSDHVFVTFEGAYLLARTTGDPTQMRRQLAVVRRLLESVLK